MHAHRLVFTGVRRLDLAAFAPNLRVDQFPDFETLRDYAMGPSPYLYIEDSAGCQLGWLSLPLPRQFLRGLAAIELGLPHLADWRVHPRLEVVEAARMKLFVIKVAGTP
jgi:hypothetical protein